MELQLFVVCKRDPSNAEAEIEQEFVEFLRASLWSAVLPRLSRKDNVP